MSAHLLAAAARRHDEAATRATAALLAMSRAGEPINFVAVARAAGCSTDFLYRNPQLRARIEDLRTSTPALGPSATDQPTTGTEPSSAVRILSGQIKQMRARHREDIARLERALAAAHGENLRLRRAAAAKP